MAVLGCPLRGRGGQCTGLPSLPPPRHPLPHSHLSAIFLPLQTLLHGRCEVEGPPSAAVWERDPPLQTVAWPRPWLPPCLLHPIPVAGWPSAASPTPRAREGTVGAESEPQCHIHCCIMSLFIRSGNSGSIFTRMVLPMGRGWAGLLMANSTWQRFLQRPDTGRPGRDSQGPWATWVTDGSNRGPLLSGQNSENWGPGGTGPILWKAAGGRAAPNDA